MSSGRGDKDDRDRGGDQLSAGSNNTRIANRADLPIFAEAGNKDRDDSYKNLVNPHSTTEFKGGQFIVYGSALRRLAIVLEYRLAQMQSVVFNLIERERELHSHFNLVPVLFGIGILIYFLAPSEPNLVVSCLTAFGLFVFGMKLQTYGVLRGGLVSLALVFAGFSVATVHTANFTTNQIERGATLKVEGIVIGVSQTTRGAPRYVIKPTIIEGLSKNQMPTRIRLSTGSKKYQTASIGQIIKGKARLQPVSGPAYPGGYDFAFHAWFGGIGGSGFFYGKPQLGNMVEADGMIERLSWYSNELRLAIQKRIIAAIPHEGGDIAVALITGDRSRLDNETQDSLRQSGLAHILAISGLHMALVSLTVVAVIRFAAAFFPNFASRHPVKKWAVGAGFIAATVYLGISGASIATQRAWIMVCVMLLAVLLDRKAITMRSVAIAAILILLIKPSSLLMPGFQMSFAAVAMLVAIYELWQSRKRANSAITTNETLVLSKLKAVFIYVSGLGFTSLIAGGATLVFSAFHFHTIASLGLLSNLLAMPIVSLLVMPLALLSMLLMPYGLESLALKPMTEASLLVVELSNWVNSLGSQIITGKMAWALFMATASGMVLFACLRTRLRLLAIVPLGFATYLSLSENSGKENHFPDLLVAENGRVIAIAEENGKAAYLYSGRSKFIRGIWEKAWPAAFDQGGADKASMKNTCGKDYCETILAENYRLAVVYDPKKIAEACASSDILVAPRLWWVNCKSTTPAIVLKRGDFEQFGAHAIYVKENGELSNSVDTTSKTNQTYQTSASSFRIERGHPSTTRPWNRSVTPK